MNNTGLMLAISRVQAKAFCPKEQGKYVKFSYRNAETILSKVRPICIEEGLLLTLNDTLQVIGDKLFTVSTATLTDTVTKEQFSTQGVAWHPDKLMSMSEPQLTGTSCSYSRKRALENMFALSNADEDPDVLSEVQEWQKQKATSEPQRATSQKSQSKGNTNTPQQAKKTPTEPHNEQETKLEVPDAEDGRARLRAELVNLQAQLKLDNKTLGGIIKKHCGGRVGSELTDKDYIDICDHLAEWAKE